MKYSIGFAQEPYIDFLGNLQANHTWTSIYPTTHKKQPKSTRSIIIVHNNINQDQWTQIDVQSPDVMAMKILGNSGDLYVFNVYLDQSHSDALFKIDRTIRNIRRTHEQSQRPVHLLWAGDFNWHLPLWDKEWNHHLFTCVNI
jgi:hypothetical protein